MRISTRGRYAVRGMADLACNSEEHPVSIREIAERQEISIDYMEQLFHKLMKAGLLKSFRGLKGGYRLSRKADQISIKEILEVVEGPISLVNCEEVVGEQTCPRINKCRTHKLWTRLSDLLSDDLGKITLMDVCERNL